MDDCLEHLMGCCSENRLGQHLGVRLVIRWGHCLVIRLAMYLGRSKVNHLAQKMVQSSTSPWGFGQHCCWGLDLDCGWVLN